jgi:TAT (twin-arginine translocation) pathway signal sequence
MKQAKKEAVADRRSFLKLAGAGAAAGGAALVTGEKEARAGEAKARPSFYRETEHIRRYYELAR